MQELQTNKWLAGKEHRRLETEFNLKQTEKNEKLEKLCRALQERKANSNDSEKENKV